MHTGLVIALAAGAALALPVSRTAQPSGGPGPHAPAVRAVAQEPHKGGRPEPHPEITGAMKELRQARADLNKGAHDFGGHRVAAIKSIDEALNHLKEALAYDRK